MKPCLKNLQAGDIIYYCVNALYEATRYLVVNRTPDHVSTDTLGYCVPGDKKRTYYPPISTFDTLEDLIVKIEKSPP